jgi:ornithine cyclodeaminase
MGADDRGKQELPVDLLRGARLFADLVLQSIEVGEFQHAAAEISSGSLHLDALGDVASGRITGRQTDEDITIFDSSGIALQDIFLADMILRECERQGELVQV